MDRDTFLGLVKSIEPDVIVLFLPSDEMLAYASRSMRDWNIIVATPKNPPSQVLVSRHMRYWRVSSVPSPGIGMLSRVKTFFTAALGEGLLKTGQRVVCYSDDDMDLFLDLDTSNIGIPSLTELVGSRADLRVLESTMEIASEIAREGREGHPVGALFIVGDEQRVLMNSKDLIRNPFESSHGGRLNITKETDTKSLKEFATLDGAVVLDGNGNALSAGRYVMVKEVPMVSLEEGLGGRHLAAAYITKVTRAVSIVVSQSHMVRVFKDGMPIYEVKSI